MRGVTQLKSLGDLRTSISTHSRAMPRVAGSLHLELYRLEKEKGRLEAELTMLLKRVARAEARVRGVEAAMSLLLADGAKAQPRPIPTGVATSMDDARQGWRRMTLPY